MAELDISGNSIQLDCSVDSGICVEGVTKDLKKKIQEFKRILFILERDKEAMQLLRERLSRIAERNINKKKKDGQSVCNVCFTQIDSDDSKTCVACYSCAKNVCRGEKCSEWVPHDGEWRCQLCAAQRDSYGKASTWVQEQQAVKRASLTECSYPMRARSEIYIPLCDPNESAFLCNFESVSEVASPTNPNQKQHIREYIEEVLAEMIGGSLRNSTVEQISTNKDYQQVRSGHELQGVSNVRLRRLIESIIAETIRQPPVTSAGLITTTSAIDSSDIDHGGESLPLNGNANHCNGNGGQYFESKQYHDLLATAVLNKIVNTHGNGRLSESSPDLTSSSVLDSNHNAINLNKTDESVSSSSSVEPRSESSLTDPIRSINKDEDGNFGNFYHDDVANDNIEADRESVLSDFISSHMVPLPHISAEPASEEDEDEEDYISVASSRDANWEDNWLFKKKKSNKTSSSSVGMLVPAPKEDIRALIGDKPTDEVSDLSEIGSDTDDSSLEMISASLEPLNDRLVNKHLIGGKNTKIVLDELVDRTSMISTSSLPDNEPPYTETKNEFVVSNDGLNESQSLKISVNNCNKAISNEAINSNVTKAIPAKVEKLTKEGQVTEDESIVPPPNDFTDDEKMRNLLAKFNEEQHNKTDSGDENSSSMSPRSSISCALSDRISSESNCTDDSTTTVIDTFGSMESRSNSDSSGEEFSPDDSTDRDSSATATTANNSILTTTNKATNQSHIYSPPPPPLPLQPQPELRTESACSKLLQTRTSTGGNEEHVDDDPLKHLVPGSIAEREYKKWYNAVDMPNNPYSVEALRRRLSGGLDRALDLPNISPCNEDNPLQLSESPAPEAETKGQERDYSRYSRDYYINDAKQASGTTKKSPTSPPQVSSPTSTASSIELDERVKHNSQTVETTPVKEMCHKLEKQCRIEADIYLATPVQVIEDIEVPQAFADKKPIQTVGRTITTSLTTEAVSRLSSDTSSILTNESLTPSEDSDTIRIYDLKKQETRLVKETTQTTTITVPKSPEKKVRPTELDIMPTLAPPIATVSAKCSTPTSFKFLQPKRKLINPSQVLSIDQDSTPLTPSTPEKTVIEAEVVHAMPSVKALAKAFLMTSSTSSSDNKWRKARAKTPMQFFKPTTPTATSAGTSTIAASFNRGIQKQPEPVIPDTTSQGSEDATIASDLSSLETDPPSRIDGDTLDEDRVVLSGCLRNNIAFFENLKNK